MRNHYGWLAVEHSWWVGVSPSWQTGGLWGAGQAGATSQWDVSWVRGSETAPCRTTDVPTLCFSIIRSLKVKGKNPNHRQFSFPTFYFSFSQMEKRADWRTHCVLDIQRETSFTAVPACQTSNVKLTSLHFPATWTATDNTHRHTHMYLCDGLGQALFLPSNLRTFAHTSTWRPPSRWYQQGYSLFCFGSFSKSPANSTVYLQDRPLCLSSETC